MRTTGELMKTAIFAILIFALPLAAKDKDAKPNYAVNCDNPHSYSCTQYLRLELKQQKVLQSYAAYQADLAALNAEATVIEKENGWPSDLRFDGQTLTFAAPPPAPVAQEKK